MMLRPFAILAPAMISLALYGCAGANNGSTAGASADNAKGLLAATPIKTGSFTDTGSYNPSAEESAQSCKRIRGKMGVRIVQLQRTGIVRDSSILSRKFSGYFGGDKRGYDAATNRKRDRAVLVAYNALLAKKNCETFDLKKELAKPK